MFHDPAECIKKATTCNIAVEVSLPSLVAKEVIRAFAGDPVGEHVEASRYADSLYLVTLPKLADITIASAFPLEVAVQASKALDMAAFCTRAGEVREVQGLPRNRGPLRRSGSHDGILILLKPSGSYR